MRPSFIERVRTQVLTELAQQYNASGITYEEYLRAGIAVTRALDTLLEEVREESEKRDRDRGGYRYDNV